MYCAAELMKEGSTVTLRNAKIDMFKGSMRLAVDKSCRVEVAEPASFTVMADNNLSLIEFERLDFAMWGIKFWNVLESAQQISCEAS